MVLMPLGQCGDPVDLGQLLVWLCRCRKSPDETERLYRLISRVSCKEQL